MKTGYALTEPGIVLGSPMLGAELLPDVRVQVAARDAQPARPHRGRDRHGQDQDPAAPGRPAVDRRRARSSWRTSRATSPASRRPATRPTSGHRPRRIADLDVHAKAHPVEFLSLSGKLGAQVRATVHSFGPLLLGKVLGLNDTQTSILSLVFKYCDDNSLPLLDLPDLRTTLNWLASDEGKPVLAEYGGMSHRVARRAPALDRHRSSSRAPTSSSASPSSTSPT